MAARKELDIPLLGLGTLQLEESGIEKILTCAVENGYRLIDCACAYENEKEIGLALEKLMKNGKVKREDLFITSKLWNNSHHPDDVLPALKRTLKDLKLDYLDLYLIHWPYCFKRGDTLFPKDVNGIPLFDNYDYIDTWKMMEKAKEMKLATNIGVSNFNSHQLQRILDKCEIVPYTNQVEVHTYFSQKQLVNFCQSKNISVTAYCPLAHFTPRDDSRIPCAYLNNNTNNLSKDKILQDIGSRKGKSPAQIALRWLNQRGIIAIPKSRLESRIRENIQIFDFKLTSDEMKQIDDMDEGYRIVGPYIYTDNGGKLLRDEEAEYFPFKLNDDTFF